MAKEAFREIQEETENDDTGQEVEMPDAICPVCEQTVSVPQDKVYFGSRIQCSECKAFMEVIDEFPLRIKRYVSGEARGWIADCLDVPTVKEPIKPSQEDQ